MDISCLEKSVSTDSTSHPSSKWSNFVKRFSVNIFLFKGNHSIKFGVEPNMFYTTNISVTIWILNNNKNERRVVLPEETRHYRNRKNEVLFLDLREIGEPFEKKFTQFSEQHIKDIAKTYHTWQQVGDDYKNEPEYCYSATLEEIKARDYSLVPSKYIAFVNRDENIDFDDKMTTLKAEFTDLLREEEKSKNDLIKVFKELGYEIEL